MKVLLFLTTPFGVVFLCDKVPRIAAEDDLLLIRSGSGMANKRSFHCKGVFGYAESSLRCVSGMFPFRLVA